MGDDLNSGESLSALTDPPIEISVAGPLELSISVPTQIITDLNYYVTAVVTNAGDQPVSGVNIGIATAGPVTVIDALSAALGDIDAGDSVPHSWQMLATAAGGVSVVVSAEGTDTNTAVASAAVQQADPTEWGQLTSIIAELQTANVWLESIDSGVAQVSSDIGDFQLALVDGEGNGLLELINASIIDIAGDTATITTDWGDVVMNIDAISTSVASIAGDTATIVGEWGTMQASLDSLNATLESVDGNVATIVTDLGTVQASLDDLNATVTSIDGNVATVTTDVGVIKGNVASIDGNVATITTDIGTMEANIALMTDDMDTLASNSKWWMPIMILTICTRCANYWSRGRNYCRTAP
jgi:archaellum component FlaC